MQVGGNDYSFHTLCGAVGKKCARVCDWEGTTRDCNDVSQRDINGNPVRDGTRVAFCVP